MSGTVREVKMEDFKSELNNYIEILKQVYKESHDSYCNKPNAELFKDVIEYYKGHLDALDLISHFIKKD